MIDEVVSSAIQGLSEFEAKELVKDLTYIDKKIDKKIKYVMFKTDVSFKEALEYVVNEEISLWAKVHCSWEARDYQDVILSQVKKKKKVVLRLGRRLGKTECMIITILWHAFRQPNKRDSATAAYEILILTPFETQIDLIFDRLNQIISSSESLKSMEKKSIHHRIEFNNGSIIKGITVGASSGKGAANTRGQAARLLVLDESDYMGSKEITNILNIANEDLANIKIVAASTPSGKHEEFYQWCSNASVSFTVKKEDIEHNRFTGFIETKKEKGNGWTEVWAPSLVNKTILEINPETGQTYLEDIKDELTAVRYEQEVMAEFGDMEMGVYKKDHLDFAYSLGDQYMTKYWEEYSNEEKAMFKATRNTKTLVAAVDWDIGQTTPTLMCLMFDKSKIHQCFEVLFRLDIPRTIFTLTSAVDKLIELNEEFNFDHVILDRGMGEAQVEIVKKYGISYPESGLHLKTEGLHFGSSVEIIDPHTRKKVKRDVKPFMVDNSVLVFERHKILLNEKDKILKRQLNSYAIEKIGVSGRPVFTSEDEHSVDTLNMALLVFQMKYGDLFKRIIKGIVNKVEVNGNLNEKWNDRSKAVGETVKNERYSVIGVSVNRRNNPTRRGRFKRGGY